MTESPLRKSQKGSSPKNNNERKKKKEFATKLFITGGDGIADFPAVFFHISHWYLSWNTAVGGDCI